MMNRVISCLYPTTVARKIVVLCLSLLLVVMALALGACASQTPGTAPTAPAPNSTQAPTSSSPPAPVSSPVPKPSGPIKGRWIEAQVDGDTVSIPQSDVEKNWNVHFKVSIQGGTENFMAYLLGDKIYVRANVCPPCQSIGYSLDEDVLVCDRCATRFKAKSGDGIDGACVKYPKASVPYEIIGGNLVMKNSDLLTAYQNTLKQGWP